MNDKNSFYKKHMELPEEVTKTTTFRTIKSLVLWCVAGGIAFTIFVTIVGLLDHML